MANIIDVVKNKFFGNIMSINMFNTALSKVLRNIIGFLCSVLISRQLGVESKGDFSYYMLIFSMVATYCTFGINQGMLYYLKRSDYTRDNIVSTTFSSLILIFICILLVFLGLMNFGIININSLVLFFLGMLFVLSSFYQDALNLIHIGDQKIKRTNNCFLIAHFTKLLLTIIAYYFNLITIKTAVLFEVIDVIVCVILLYVSAEVKLKLNFNFLLAIKEIRYGVIIIGASLLTFLLFRIDQIYIKKYLSSESLGIYSTAASLCDIIRIIPASIAMNMMGDIYNKKPFSDEAKNTIAYGIKLTLYTTIIVAIFTYCFLFLVPIVYGAEYREVVPVMKILLVGVCFTSIASVAAVYYQCCGKPNVLVAITFMSLTTEVLFCGLLIDKYGIYGAAYASAIAYGVYGLLYLFMLNRVEKIKLNKIFLFNLKKIN